MSGLTDRVMRYLGPALASRAGPLLSPLVRALTADADDVDTLLSVPDAPLSSAPLTDARVTPYPHWLGQAAGLRVPASLSTSAARALIMSRGVSRRGTPGALLAAARTALTGTAIARLIERAGGDAYAATLVTYAIQTPDPAAVLRAASAEKPVGIVLTLDVRAGQSWGDVARAGYTLGDLKSITVDELRRAAPRA